MLRDFLRGLGFFLGSMGVAQVCEAGDARAEIIARVGEEFLSAQSSDAVKLACDLVQHYGGAVAAVLFYGSCLRNGTSEGLLDLYILVDGYRAAGMSPIAAGAAHLLPPAVYHHTLALGGRILQAKVAVITTAQFRCRMRPDTLDASLWARFCQPVALLYARDAGVTNAVAAGLADAILAAALWAARLGPEAGCPAEYWLALFRATYAAELRVEHPDKAGELYAAAADRYAALLPMAWGALGLPNAGKDRIENPFAVDARLRFTRSWHRRRWPRRALNALRLVKAAFTFAGGADYIAWKIERHTGCRLALSGFQRKHPVLAMPSLLWRLIRRRVAG